MTKLLSFFRSINGQIATLVVCSIMALHVTATSIFLIQRPGHDPLMEFDQLVSSIRLLAKATASERPLLISVVGRTFPDFNVRDLPADLLVAGDPAPFDERELHHRLGKDYRVFALAKKETTSRIGVLLPDGTAVSADVPLELHPPPFWHGPGMMMLLSAVICVTLLSLWAARALTAPLSSFAKAAEDFSLNGAAESLPERGPQEIRFVARALNRMRERITGLIDDRTRMLAAISHDLRTPITRMRLRSEFIDDEAQRSRMLADLDQMRSMLDSVLSFLRNDRRLEAVTPVDVACMMQLIADQFCDMGHKVTYDGLERAMITACPGDLHRGITNLVENAVRFGTETTIRLVMSKEQAVIAVEDNGPGISDARKDDMLQPFVRGDSARNMDEAAGFGLGLSIAKAIVLAHGGELSLHDSSPHGLRVRVQIPIWSNGESPQPGRKNRAIRR